MAKTAVSRREQPADIEDIQERCAPRKLPSQKRARVTVDCILEAAESIIASEGYEVATTNRIAEVAGVSIGTLYQYFPGKEAIVAAIVENAVIRTGTLVRERLIENMHLPLRESLPRVVQMILETRKTNVFILLRLPREVAKFGKLPQLTTERFLYTTIRAYFLQHRDEIRIEDIDTAMHVCEHLVVGAIHDYLEDLSPKLTDAVLVDHICDAVIKYLTK